MKKIFFILVLGLFFNTKLLADVYYCIDAAVAGFTHEDGDYKVANYKPEKFKAKINFDKGTIDSKVIGFTSNTNCEKITSQKFSMGCSTKWGDIFTIEGDKGSIDSFNYVRAKTYGRTDSIFTAHGNCEKF